MPRLQLIRQAPRGLGNNLKAPDDGVEGLKIVTQALVTMAVRELFGQVDVPEHVAERAAFFLRKHRTYRARQARADEA